MTNLSNINKGATRQAHKSGTVNAIGEANHGKQAYISVYADTCGYAHTPTAWFVLSVEGKKPYVKRCSGRNYDKAMAEFVDCQDLIQEVQE